MIHGYFISVSFLPEDDTDQASSGFEDATSQVTTERQRIKTASDISSNWKKSKNGKHRHVHNISSIFCAKILVDYIDNVLKCMNACMND